MCSSNKTKRGHVLNKLFVTLGIIKVEAKISEFYFAEASRFPLARSLKYIKTVSNLFLQNLA